MMLTTVTEMPEYIRRSIDLLSESECKGLIDYLAAHPRAGDIMEGTGGIRKVRWGRGDRGKRAVFGLFTTITTNGFHSTCLLSLAKMSGPILLKSSETTLPN